METFNRENLEDIEMCLGIVANAEDTPFSMYQELAVIQEKVRSILTNYAKESDNGA